MERNLLTQSPDLDMSWGDLFNEPIAKRTVYSGVDAMICSLNDKGMIDIEYMSEISNFSMSSLIEELDDYIFQDPAAWNECWYKGFKTKEEYLSGDILNKLELAIEANKKFNGIFEKNIEALKEVMPTTVPYKDIHFSIASSWMDKDLIISFITNLFKGQVDRSKIMYVPETNKWIIPESVMFYNSANYTFGTSRIDTKSLILRILNHKEVCIYDTIEVDGKKKQQFNKEETILALEKVEILEKAFRTFIEKSGFKSIVERAYNERFRYVINRKYDGSFLNLPKLYDYQKDAVARIIFNKNTLLAHNVGAGKTYIMVSAGEELLRLGYSTKNLYVVPNSIIGQWEEFYRNMYPNSNILVVYPKDYTINTKDAILDKMKNGNYSAVITTYSVFDRIEHSIDNEIDFINDKINELSKINHTGQYYLGYHIDTHINALKKKLNALKAKPKPTSLTFEELGFTRLFLDEAHNYKNIGIDCSKTHISGISSGGSTKCNNMLIAVDYLNTNGHGVIMATGTPITNSVTDIYVFQRYLQRGELKLLDIDTFDKWLSVFAEVTDEIEVDVDTTKYAFKTRVSKFYNIEELTVLLSNVSDFCNPNQSKVLPKCDGYIDTVIGRNVQFDLFLRDISRRVDHIRKHLVNRKDDNLLKVTVDGRLAALDLRLIDSAFIKSFDNKIDRCAANVYDVYTKHPDTTQIIFCDLSVPKDSFNVYDDLKLSLVKLGINPDEIDFIHNATTEAKRKKMLKNFNDGKIRILVGSTSKLGTGVNVQAKLIAIHHLDVPWRPSDMMQREGRIIREGNTNPIVYMYRYIQKSSFDAYSWQILERKAKIIRDMLANTLTEKETEDIDDVVLSYAEVKALAVGNAKIKEHIELRNKRSHLVSLAKKQNERYVRLQNECDSLKERINVIDMNLQNKKKDFDAYYDNKDVLDDIFANYDCKGDLEKSKEIKDFLESHIGQLNDKVWFSMPGFEIIIPRLFLTKNKYLVIKGNHRYQSPYREKTQMFGLHLKKDLISGASSTYMDNLSKRAMQQSIKSIDNELKHKISYADEIKELNVRISLLEGELGIHESKSDE